MSDHINGALDQVTSRLLARSRGVTPGQESAEQTQETHKAIVERLTRRYGEGTKPHARKAFYLKLQRAVDSHGEEAYAIISACVQASDTAGKNAVLWFCRSVKARLFEAGLWQEPKPVEW